MQGPSNSDLLGKAILDYHNSKLKSDFVIHYPDLEPDEMPIEVFFRDYDEMPEIEKYALSLVKGKVLDIGAGAGAHSLVLQEHGIDVTALDNSAESCQVMRQRGILNVVHSDIFRYQDSGFDTILLLMNGIGLSGNLENLGDTINHLNGLLSEKGQIIFDSSDLEYLERNTKGYYGEMKMYYEYADEKSSWESWLYIDPYTLIDYCKDHEIPLEILIEDETGLYLAKVPKF